MKYRIERRIAQGGFANVYQAWDSIEGVHVALKMPHQFNVTASMLDTFQREARVVAKLVHPNNRPLYTSDALREQSDLGPCLPRVL